MIRSSFGAAHAAVCALVFLCAPACDSARAPNDEAPAASCSGCHGTEASPHPPPGLLPGAAGEDLAAGAHAAHLEGKTAIAAPMGCADCHRVPKAVSDPGHIDDPEGAGRAEVAFGPRATLNGRLRPSYDPETRTCSSTACHDAASLGRAGGPGIEVYHREDGLAEAPAPSWSEPEGIRGSCTACHGSPPAGDHPDSSKCSVCHGQVVSAEGAIVAPEMHVDGWVQVEMGSVGCGTCHGSDGDPAPPPDLQGESDPASASVGLHAVHRQGGRFGGGLPCSTCHVVPGSVNAPGHLDEAPAEVVFSGLATWRGAKPTYDPDTATCSSTYCHGRPETAPAVAEPAWTGSTVLGCDGCHALPPPTPGHASLTEKSKERCASCHLRSLMPDGSIDLEAGKHLNGVVEVF
jgi:predicted CxxxxCH...CXXCH cytochrome family protein